MKRPFASARASSAPGWAKSGDRRAVDRQTGRVGHGPDDPTLGRGDRLCHWGVVDRPFLAVTAGGRFGAHPAEHEEHEGDDAHALEPDHDALSRIGRDSGPVCQDADTEKST